MYGLVLIMHTVFCVWYHCVFFFLSFFFHFISFFFRVLMYYVYDFAIKKILSYVHRNFVCLL